MNWTDERVELLKKLWSEGLSASQIATQLGGVSRNAVIGKVHRLKLSGRGRASSATPRAKKTAPSAPKGPRPSRPVTTSIGATALQARFDAEPDVAPAPRLSSVVVPISRNLTLLDLSERTCKWPNGDPLAEEFSFCGNDVGEAGPYCGYHSRVAYQPVAERRRSR
ncbi:GcrA cell cycle regulator [Aliihoeflea aestuarii]|jgi:GcrA cell cycle regulator|uniref:GcrA family cell cycle regulator n=1 Tax=Aliihoeflea aestuarii TaxID=453840 RepID=UPI002092E82F|nr:GcrA family cell cycle regulator [Aliihoeflea aestuarii]MCO6389843.1 GcrA cell cycle regulator [Aliihoeflea aestuarii]